MANNPHISIIIINWNTRDILLECLKSIDAERSGPSTEVILVDNGSEDRSVEAVRERFPAVRIIENGENLGFAKANNIGIGCARGRYLCFVNSDVLLRPACMGTLFSFAESNPAIGLIGPRILYPNLSLQNSCRRFPSLWTSFVKTFALDHVFQKSSLFSGEHMEYFSHDQTIDTDYVAGCFMMVRREAIDSVGPMDERFFIYSEEVDWCKRMWAKGWRVTFYPKAEVIHHHGSSSSRETGRFDLERQKALLAYWKKHHGWIAQAVNIALVGLRSALRIVAARVLLLFPHSDPEGRISESLRLNRGRLDALIRGITDAGSERLE